ncbi:MAG TPA: MFS transporter, partial [Myxococcaceae bacterium]|nr:MFS transporter [Myxococcaceae bacterium]
RFTSLFMGVWFLGISAAYYLAGSLGELWGRVPPVDYFQVFVWTAALGTGALLLFARPLRRLMHGVE